MKATIHSPDEQDEYYFKEGCHILELSNSADDEDVSIARARVAPGVRTTPHRLAGISERYVILQGSGRAEIANMPAREVSAGDVIIIPPGSSQSISNTGSTDLVFLAICHPRFVPAAYSEIGG